jgi:WD40 repeat protein/serine/threonine protein kinase
MPARLAPDETLVPRLPLPLAQLYRRAHNARTPLERHLTASLLWEASLKLLGAVGVIEYAHLGGAEAAVSERLQNLARPAVGHWWEFVRLLAPLLSERGDAGFTAVRDLLLGRSRDDLPRLAGLDAILREVQDGQRGERATVRLIDLFDRLVRHRNQEVGHGAVAQRPAEFYERVGAALLAGLGQLLDRLDVLAGRRLLFVGDVRRLASGAWRIERYELRGETVRRLESLEAAAAAQAEALPRPGLLYLSPAESEEPAAWRLLHPLLIYEPEGSQVFFLNARRGQRQAEYLCYATGATVKRSELGHEQRELLARVLGGTVDDAVVAAWETRSEAEEPAVSVTPPEPQRRLGEFELMTRIGRGGMGVVYRAWQPSLGRQVALKCLLRSGDPKAETRFAREIKALGRVEHPNLVKVFTSGAEGDQWFYAMELLEGAPLAAVSHRLQTLPQATQVDERVWQETLHTVCREVREAEQPIGPPSDHAEVVPGAARTLPPGVGRHYVQGIVELVRQIALAAHALHDAGVVHRDIKPGNIMVAAEGDHAVLMDLGLAQLADEAEGRLTRTRQFVGTLRYASPEQVLAAGALDRRSDVYSLGATLWELLTLRPLYGATDQMPTPELMQRIQIKEPERLRRYNPHVPADLEAIVFKCLEKDLDRRYPTARDLAEDLGRFLQNEPVRARPVGAMTRLVKWARRRPAIATLAGTSVLLAVVLVIVLVFANLELRHERNVARAQKEAAEQGERDLREAQQQAARAAAEARQVSFLVADGMEAVEEGDLIRSLPSLTRALLLERGKPGEEAHRLRLARTLERCPRIVQLFGHGGPVQQAFFSPDGTQVVAVAEGAAWRWDVRTGRQIGDALRHLEPVRLARFASAGDRLASVGDKSVRLWDTRTGDPVALLAHGKKVQDLAFSPSGQFLATACADGVTRLWSTADGKLRASLQDDKVKSAVTQGVFSPDERWLATASGEAVDIWDVATGKLFTTPLKHDAPVIALAFDSGAPYLRTLDENGKARLWEIHTGAALARGGSESVKTAAAYSPNGIDLFTINRDGSAKWERLAELGRERKGRLIIEAVTGNGTGSERNPPAPKFEPDPNEKIQTKYEVAELTHPRPAVQGRFSGDARRLAVVCRDQGVYVWTPSAKQSLPAPLRHPREVAALDFSPDGRLLLTACEDGLVRIWAFADDTPALIVPSSDSYVPLVYAGGGRAMLAEKGRRTLWDLEANQPVVSWESLPGEVWARCASDGIVFVTGGSGTARFHDGATGRPKGKAVPCPPDTTFQVLSRDGSLLALTAPGRAPCLWDRRRETFVIPPWRADAPREPDAVIAGDRPAAFNHDGSLLAGVENGNLVRFWDTSTGAVRGDALPHPGPVFALAFSPDGRHLLTGSTDVAQLWEVQTGKPALPPLWHRGAVPVIEFGANGRVIVTASADRTARLWDTTTGEPLVPSLRHESEVIDATLSADGRWLATLTKEGVVRVWDATSGAPLLPPLRPGSRAGYLRFGPENRLIGGCADGVRIWNLTATGDWSMPELLRRVELLEGRRHDPDRGFLPLDAATLVGLHRAVDPEGSAALLAPDAIRSWHRAEALRCERTTDWFAATWHWRAAGSVGATEESAGSARRAWRSWREQQGARFGDPISWLAVRARSIVRREQERWDDLKDLGVALRGLAGPPAARLPLSFDPVPDSPKDNLRFTIKSPNEGYLYLFGCTKSDEIWCLSPAPGQSPLRLRASEVHHLALNALRRDAGVPRERRLFDLEALVTSEPLDAALLRGKSKDEPAMLGRDLDAVLHLGEIARQLRDPPRRWGIALAPLPTAPLQVGVCIGINKYRDTDNIRNLKCSVQDARKMAEVLKQYRRLDQAHLLLDEEATLSNIAKLISQDLPAKTQPGDTVVIYWSGHGGRCPDTTGKAKDGQSCYLVPHDGKLDSEEATMLLDRTFARWIEALEDREVLVILDTVHAGGMAEMLAKRPKTSVLAACARVQYSFERREEDHGVLTYYLLRYLEKKPRRRLNLEEAFTEVRDRVKRYVMENVEGSSQDPQLFPEPSPKP